MRTSATLATLPVVALAAPARHADDRMGELFGQWWRVMKTPEFTNKQHESAVLTRMDELERQIMAMPSETARDLAIKVTAYTGNGTLEISEEFREEQIVPLLPRVETSGLTLAIPAPSIARAQPDAELIELGRQWARTAAKWHRLNRQCSRICRQIEEEVPEPAALEWQEGDEEWAPIFGATKEACAEDSGKLIGAAIGFVRSAPPNYAFKRPQEIKDAVRGWLDCHGELQEQRGANALSDEMNNVMGEQGALEKRIVALRAESYAGLAVQARVAKEWQNEPDEGNLTMEFHKDATLALIEGAQRLAKAA